MRGEDVLHVCVVSSAVNEAYYAELPHLRPRRRPEPHRQAQGGFFFQAEDGIRHLYVTGVQTCALPICRAGRGLELQAVESGIERGERAGQAESTGAIADDRGEEIGRASCRERV